MRASRTVGRRIVDVNYDSLGVVTRCSDRQYGHLLLQRGVAQGAALWMDGGAVADASRSRLVRDGMAVARHWAAALAGGECGCV